MEFSGILGIVAALIHTLAYLDYNSGVLKGTRKPNGPTWIIWATIATLSATSYFSMSGDLAKSALPLMNIGLCIATFGIAWWLKCFKKPSKYDVGALVIGLSAGVIWKIYQSAEYANLILQVAITIGFMPTFLLVWENPRAESPRPWLIWTFAYIVMLVTVMLRWRGQWYDLVYPINSIVLHTAVTTISIVRVNRLERQHDSYRQKRFANTGVKV